MKLYYYCNIIVIYIFISLFIFQKSFTYNIDIDSLSNEEKINLANLKIPTNNYLIEFNQNVHLLFELLSQNNIKLLESINNRYHVIEILEKEVYILESLLNLKIIERHYNRYRFHRDIMLWSLPNDPLFPEQWHLHEKSLPGNKLTLNEPSVDLNVINLYNQGLTGSGVIVAVVDDGVQWNHTELIEAYFPEGSWDFNGNDNDPSGSLRDYHGTSVAGVVAARDNDMCGVGVAYRAMISGIRLLGGPTNDLMESKALSYRNDLNAIYSSSWGPNDDAMRLDGPGFLTKSAILQSTQVGRGGLGSIYVWAGGNGGGNGDNCNYDGYANSRFVITVGACDFQGKHVYYSEPCAALHVTAPSSGGNHSIITSGASHKYGDNCNRGFGGTSSTAPQVSGIIAILLQARPNDLSWRDIQHIIILSAKRNDPDDIDWSQNGAGHYVNHKYGYGMADAEAAFNLTLLWTPLSEYISLPIAVNYSNITIEASSTITSSISIPESIIIEHVEMVFTAEHPIRGKLSIELTSPSNTNSILATEHRDPNSNYSDWTFTTMRCLGESSNGTWTLKVTDHQVKSSTSRIGTLNYWKLLIYGHNNV